MVTCVTVDILGMIPVFYLHINAVILMYIHRHPNVNILSSRLISQFMAAQGTPILIRPSFGLLCLVLKRGIIISIDSDRQSNIDLTVFGALILNVKTSASII